MKIDIGDTSLMIVMPVNRDLPWQTAKALCETSIELTKRGIVFDIQLVVGSSIIELARSKATNIFLRGDHDKMLMIDSDQTFTASDVLRILALSTVMGVVCGAYPVKQDPTYFMMDLDTGPMELNRYGCMAIRGAGLGFCIVDREILEALASKAPRLTVPGEDEPIPHIFRCDAVNGVFRGEDMAFLADCNELGAAIWLDPTLQIGHVGAKEYRADFRDAMQKIA